MKRILLIASAIAGMFLTAACQQELYEPETNGTVTYEITLPAQMQTKGSDGYDEYDLYYEVYRQMEDGTLALLIDKVAEKVTSPVKLPLELLNNQKYTVLFWANKAGAKDANGNPYFNTENLQNVTMNSCLSNDDNRDAFCGVDEEIVVDDKAQTAEVTLKRPFAQVNIATLVKSVDELGFNSNLKTSKVTFASIPNTFNVLADEPVVTDETPEVEFTFDHDDVPVGNLDNTEYKYAALNYIFVGNKKDLVSLTYEITTASGKVTKTIDNVPVQQNYRTNIVGNLLTSGAQYTITVEPGFVTPNGEYTVIPVQDANGLQEAIENAGQGDEIKLEGDINLNDLINMTRSEASSPSLIIPAGRTLSLNLNGHKLSGEDKQIASFGLINIAPGADLTITGPGSIELSATNDRDWNAYSSVVSNQRGTLTVNGGAVIEHRGGTDMAYAIDNLTNTGAEPARTTVERATIKSPYRAIRQFLNSPTGMNELYIKAGAVVEGTNKSIWMQDTNVGANLGKLFVYDNALLKGDAYLSVTAGSTEWPVYVSIADSALQDESTVLTSNVPALYDVVLKDGFWTIESSFSLATFVEAVIAAEGNYDGHGQTIKIIPVSGRSDNTNGCLVPNRLQKYGNPDVYYAQYQRFAELENVNISNVNFVFVPSAITVEDAWNTAGATTTAENVNGELQFMNAGSVTLTNCTFDKVAVSPINAATLTVNDCQFDGLNAYAIKDIKAKNVSIINTEFDNCNGGFWFNAAPASLIVTGNTFTTVGGRGAIQFSANGDYSNTTLNIAGNKVVGEGAFLWQLNKTITGTQIKPVSENNEYTTLYVDGSVIPADIAKIGDKIYTSLSAAVEAVKDGETIMLIADEIFTETNRCNNGGWWDGLAYSGDKSFTIDLGGYTIKQDGSLNDYLIWIKNDGAKANTITFKNGTMDAGTTAYCAIATASSNAQKITLNLEDINLINNISNGAVVKARGGSELNVKAGTVITGKNSYVGIEAAGTNTVVNVYEGAEIYQNGTSSYVGAIAGASQNATLNIYGGKGKSAKCGIIVMSTGAVVNVSGGEWTANVDGSVAGGNQAVLVSQNNRHETSWARKSILNVTGGIFKGGYDCWGMGPGQEPDDAQINIKGGNFNANPANYVVAGYEATENAGTYTVDKPAALKALEAALEQGGNVTLTNDVTLLESIKVKNKVVLDLNGKTITAPLFSAFEVKTGGELTVKNGKVVAYESTVRAIGGKVTVESGEYTSTGTALDTPSTYRYSLDCREGGELIINGGTFKSNNGMINVGSTVTINGGKFENIVEKAMTRHFAYVSAPLTINDGEFYGKANGAAGGCFFCGAAAGGDIQVNGGKFTSLWTSGSVNRIFEYYYGGTITVTGGMFNTNGGIANFVTENTDEATKAAYPYVAK